jgi:hypothetical protein
MEHNQARLTIIIQRLTSSKVFRFKAFFDITFGTKRQRGEIANAK